MDHPEYFFAWMKPKGSEYITSICGWSKESVKKQAIESNGHITWRQIYNRGGRIIKAKVTPK